jgi:hypothetical protein
MNFIVIVWILQIEPLASVNIYGHTSGVDRIMPTKS